MSRRLHKNQFRSKGVRKLLSASGLLMLTTVLLTGCLYPKESGQDIKVSYTESVKRIQSAVDDFYKEQQVLPILTAGSEVPKYEKYRIDLEKLHGMGYIDDIPKTAFEKGGSGYFLIINEETDPQVAVMDLVTTQKVNDVQQAVNRYKSSNNGKLPAGEELYPGLFRLDLSLTDASSTKLNSVYSGQEVDFIMDAEGNVYVDYAFDIMQAVQKIGKEPEPGEDLRVYLEQASYFVPVKSVPYTWENNQPSAKIDGIQ